MLQNDMKITVYSKLNSKILVDKWPMMLSTKMMGI